MVGAGYWGPKLVRNLAGARDVDVACVCDLSEEKARKVAAAYGDGITICTSVEEVLDDDRIEAVAIATPASTHSSLGLAFLESGKHVLMEKPLASSLSEAEKLVDAARQHGLVLMCDHTFCYSPAVQQIRDWIRDGTVGEIRYFDSVRINLGLIQSDVDVFWDLGPHDLSILDFILPDSRRPEAVAAHAADPLGVGHPCVGYLTLPLSGGAIAHLTLNWLSPTKIRTTIIGGSDQMVVWDDLDPAYRLKMYDKGVDLGQALEGREREQPLVSYRTGAMTAPALPEVEALSEVVREFVSAIRERRRPSTDGESGLRIVKVLEATQRSLDGGGALVPLD